MCFIEDLNPMTNPLKFARVYAGVEHDLVYHLNWTIAVICGDKNKERKEGALKLIDDFFNRTSYDHLDDTTHWIKGPYCKDRTIEEELKMTIHGMRVAYTDLIMIKREFDPDYVPQEEKENRPYYIDDNDVEVCKIFNKLSKLYE